MELSQRALGLTAVWWQMTIIDAIYIAYFEYGQNIGNIDVLVSIAAENGLDADNIREVLSNNVSHEAVTADFRQSQQIGVTGVPFFVIDNLLAFGGAQLLAVILDVLQQALTMREEDKS